MIRVTKLQRVVYFPSDIREPALVEVANVRFDRPFRLQRSRTPGVYFSGAQRGTGWRFPGVIITTRREL